jgi:hypothetical protein
MTRRTSLPGSCGICAAELKKATAAKHLEACLARTAGTIPYVIVKAEGEGLAGSYWLFAAIPAASTLKELDSFLRRTWLECCGHMSEFRSGRMSVPKSVSVGDFSKGEKLVHEYDFGDTTELVITIGETVLAAKLPGREKIKLLARNSPPEVICDVCDRPAVAICPMCAYDGEGWLCEECVVAHECGEEMLLPVTNSPRCGICGYEG